MVYDGKLVVYDESLSARRAWIEIARRPSSARGSSSLSARRAWIEIAPRTGPARRRWVALRKESVDRNVESVVPESGIITSLSARRAWIEISISLQWLAEV